MPKNTGRLHLPEILYGGLDNVADQLDEIGSEATNLELSCAIVNGLRVLHQLQARVAKIDKHIESLVGIAKQQAACNTSSSGVSAAIEDLVRLHSGRLDVIERELERAHNARKVPPR
jgi:hypothetical protein